VGERAEARLNERLYKLSTHLAERTADILSRWSDAVSQDPAQPAARHHLRGEELTDHLPQLLESLIGALRGEAPNAVTDRGAEHGHQRRVIGYTAAELLDEIRVFRQFVMATIDECRDQIDRDTAAEAGRRLLDLIDESAHASVVQYLREAEAERDLARMRLEERNAQLDAANAQKDQFLSVLSHELRNPLAPIVTAVQVLQRIKPSDPLSERQLAIIERQATHLGKLVDDLLDVNRIAHGKIDLQPRIIDFQDPARLAIESSRAAIAARQIALHVDMPADPLRVFADPTRVVQVITNLLVNAGKFTETGGRIDVRMWREGGQAALSVRDTGIGIAPETLRRVFDPFSQADTSLQRQSSGLGLGLVIAKGLVEMQSGRIDAASEGLGCGAEFTVRFPLALAAARFREPQPNEEHVPVAVRRVVLVEDNDDSREALGAALELLGHEVLYAASGEEALQLAGARQPDAFIVDIGLPGMDGYQLARSLRRLSGTRLATLIALSGYGSRADKARALHAGFDFHLTKPADVQKLHALLTGSSEMAGRGSASVP
jgi:signal transduction histidine kinase/ActR/RegA family two-component response regulator